MLDQSAQAVGKTGERNASVASGATAATTGANEVAIGFYADSGFGDTLSAGQRLGPQRVNISNAGDMELLAEDQVVGAGAKPNASVTTGANTVLADVDGGAEERVRLAAGAGQPGPAPVRGDRASDRVHRGDRSPGAATGVRRAAVSAGPAGRCAAGAVGKQVRCGARHLSAAGRRALRI